MAQARILYVRTKANHIAAIKDEKAEKTCFINDVVDGTIDPESFEIKRNPQGKFLGIEFIKRSVNSQPGNGINRGQRK